MQRYGYAMVAVLLSGMWFHSEATLAAPLATELVSATDAGELLAADGAVEAVRQSDIAAQVAGRVTVLTVKAGDRVKAGQVLVRIDERVAQQMALAGRSQVAALSAQLDVANKEYERKQRLFKQGFLSQAALEKAESDFKSAQAQTRAQMAQAESSVVQTDLHVLTAPYSGVVSMVDVELGDMATPGKALLTVYDPSAMRVVVNVPQSRVGALQRKAGTGAQLKPTLIEIPAAPPGLTLIKSSAMTVLPVADPVSQMVQVRFDLPRESQSLSPGMFARARLSMTGQASGQSKRISVPSRAIFKRSELTAVYVLDAGGKPQLRLIRTGRVEAGRTEVLVGLEPGERVVLDPLTVSVQR